jgi:4-diphosphocytidyl-2-C-methyl-D-erythritol kinase
MAAVTIRAFAKINLALRIKGVRADGFHDVQTILQSIDLFDRVTCEARRGPFELRCKSPGVPLDSTNLAWKAARELWNAAGRAGEPRDARITLDKGIPMQAGLGGGSSDAAAALIALRRLWKLSIGGQELLEVAAGIGSDVPFFLLGGTALGLGRGEEVYALAELPRRWVVLAIPEIGVSTKDAYGWWDARRDRVPLSHVFRDKGTRPLFPVPLGNDLEPVVIDRHPVIGQLKARLSELGAEMAAMSGSGSAVFGLFTSAAAARAASRQLKHSGVRIILARFQRRR